MANSISVEDLKRKYENRALPMRRSPNDPADPSEEKPAVKSREDKEKSNG